MVRKHFELCSCIDMRTMMLASFAAVCNNKQNLIQAYGILHQRNMHLQEMSRHRIINVSYRMTVDMTAQQHKPG